MKKYLIFPFVTMIKFYRSSISPFFPATCRHQPTCSQYSIEALEKHGLFFGSYLMVKRILSCHPWGNSGYDPVPEKIKRK